MSLLEEFVFALSKVERQKLRPLQFRGTKRRIFLKILSCRDRKGIDSDTVRHTYKLTRQRYNQMLSEMLAACYRDVSPHGGVDLLQYLGNKQLFRHFMPELHRQESALLLKGNAKTLEAFYAKVFLLAEFFMIPPKLSSLIDELRDYSRRYVKVKSVAHPDDKLLLDLIAIEEQIDQSILKGFDPEQVNSGIEKIEQIYLQTHESAPLVQFKVLRALIVYRSRMSSADVDRLRNYLEQGKALINRHRHLLGFTERLFALDGELELARHTKEQAEDILHFRKYFDDKTLWRNGFPLSYMLKFFPMLLQAGELALARSYMLKYFPSNLDLIRNDVAIHYWKLLMLFHLYTGKYDEAERCMGKAFEGNKGSERNVRFEVYLRLFDAFFVALHNPFEAEDRVHRHVRYAHRHGYLRTPFLKAVGELVKCIGLDPKRAEKVRQEFLVAKDKIYYTILLFEILFNKYFPESRLQKPIRTLSS